MIHVVQSHGFGVESAALSVEWLENPASRDFPVERLTVIGMQTGDETDETKRLMETYMFPLFRRHGVRFVELARAGHLEADGIVVLQDTREPYVLHTRGVYKLSEELRSAGTVPQYAGEHRCSLKFKAWVGEQWLGREFQNAPYMHVFGYNADEHSRVRKCDEAMQAKYKIAFGFNADERSRILKSARYDTGGRYGFYPLYEWGWSREFCGAYLLARFGEPWQKSACLFCPFAEDVYKEREQGLVRLRSDRSRLVDSLVLERNSLTFNPRGQLYRNSALVEIVGRHMPEVLPYYRHELEGMEWGLYRVRRMFYAPGKAHRCVELLARGPAAHVGAQLSWTPGRATHRRGVTYVYKQERNGGAQEEFYSAGPLFVADKSRYGREWFDGRWIDG